LGFKDHLKYEGVWNRVGGCEVAVGVVLGYSGGIVVALGG